MDRLDKAMPDEHAAIADLKTAASEAQTEENAQLAARRNPAQVAEAQHSINLHGRLTRVREVYKALTGRLDTAAKAVTKKEHDAFNTAWLALLIGGAGVVSLSISPGLDADPRPGASDHGDDHDHEPPGIGRQFGRGAGPGAPR